MRRLVRWFVAHARDLPWRRTLDPYAIWVSEIMLQQTQVKTVIPYFERWIRELPEVAKLAAASPDRLHKLWEGLGYYTRVRNLQRAAQTVVARHGGSVPTDFDAILALPGIGRYTAGAISSIAFNQPRPLVDGNVIRVLARLFAIRGNPKDRRVAEKFWALATELVEAASRSRPVTLPAGSRMRLAGNCSALNQSLMELGATICTPVNPRCTVCPLKRQCVARRDDRIAAFPAVAKRPAATMRRFVAFVIRRNGRVLVRQRPGGVVNAHLWEFPNVEIPLHGDDSATVAAGLLGLELADVRPLGLIRHSITRYRIALEGYEARVKGTAPHAAGAVKLPSLLHPLPFTAAHQKLARLAGLLEPRTQSAGHDGT